jgi:small subunit ribosomal protein S7
LICWIVGIYLLKSKYYYFMSRKLIFIDRRVAISDKYASPLLGKFINCMMLDGKKTIAEKIVYKGLEKAAQKAQVDPLVMFEKIVQNAKLEYVILKRKVGANSVQIPHPIDERKQISTTLLMMKNVIREIQAKSKRSIIECIEEIFSHTFKGEGPVIKKKEENEQTAIKNRVFSHYSWMSKKIKNPSKNKKTLHKKPERNEI